MKKLNTQGKIWSIISSVGVIGSVVFSFQALETSFLFSLRQLLVLAIAFSLFIFIPHLYKSQDHTKFQ